MTERKMRRLVSSGTAVAVITLFILLGVLIYQLAALSSKKREIARLQQEYEQLVKDRDDKQSEYDKWMSEEGRRILARQHGWVLKND